MEIVMVKVYLVVFDGRLDDACIDKESAISYLAQKNCQERNGLADYYDEAPDGEKAMEIFVAEGEVYSLVEVSVPANENDDEKYIRKYGEMIDGYSRESGDVEFTLSEIRDLLH